MRRYKFTWDMIGNIDIGRPKLGPLARVEVFRLMQYCFKSVLEDSVGAERVDVLFHEAGKLSGNAYFEHYLSEYKTFGEIFNRLQTLMREHGIGILKIEKASVNNEEFIFTISEDIDCSGVTDKGFEICSYSEGFIAGILESLSNNAFKVKEVDCWSKGDRTCRFHAIMEK